MNIIGLPSTLSLPKVERKDFRLKPFPIQPSFFMGDAINNATLPSFVKDVRKNRISQIKKDDGLIELKPSSMVGKILKWLASSRLSVLTAVSAFKSARFWIFRGVPSDHSRSELDKAVDELSGSLHLSKTFHLLSPKIALAIQKSLIALDLHESVNQFLVDEHWTLQTFMDVLLPTVYVNAASHIKKNKESFQKQEKIVVSLVDVISLIIETIEAHLPDINARIDAVSSISDPKQKNEKLCELFSPMAENFLGIALPNGVKDLPLAQVPFVSEMFWKSLQNRIIPTFFIDVYQQLAPSLKKDKKEVLKQKLGGESLVRVAEMAGVKATESFALFIAGGSFNSSERKGNVANRSSTATDLSAGFTSLISGSDQLKNWLANWFRGLLSEFGTSSDENIKSLWRLFGRTIEILCIHILESLSRSTGSVAFPNDCSVDALGFLITRLYSVSSAFFEKNLGKIEDRMAILSLKGEDVKDDAQLLTMFSGMADELLEAMGLHKAEEVPLPEFLKGHFLMALKKFMPKFLLKQYFAMGGL